MFTNLNGIPIGDVPRRCGCICTKHEGVLTSPDEANQHFGMASILLPSFLYGSWPDSDRCIINHVTYDLSHHTRTHIHPQSLVRLSKIEVLRTINQSRLCTFKISGIRVSTILQIYNFCYILALNSIQATQYSWITHSSFMPHCPGLFFYFTPHPLLLTTISMFCYIFYSN